MGESLKHLHGMHLGIPPGRMRTATEIDGAGRSNAARDYFAIRLNVLEICTCSPTPICQLSGVTAL